MVSSHELSKTTRHKATISDRMIGLIHRFDSPLIGYAVKNRILALGSAVLVFGMSILLFLGLGGGFIPQLGEVDFAVATRLLTASSQSQSVEAAHNRSQV